MREVISLDRAEEERALLGRRDHTVRRLRDAFGVTVFARNGEIIVNGDPDVVPDAVRVLHRLLEEVRRVGDISEEEIDRIIDFTTVGTMPDSGIVRARDGTWLRPRTEGQQQYVAAMAQGGITVAIGPAGTGKTYLAVAMAIASMRAGEFRRLVLVRPAVEAGEKLGFLPGDLAEKVDPYLRPLYDALGDLLEFTEIQRFREQDIIEIVPLAFMRGRTLDNAFIILDEAQNTTPEQMMMFLTRMGRNSAIVATGDITQVDLPTNQMSGLVDAQAILAGIEGVSFVHLSRLDIVRHPLVQKIVDAYEARGRSLPGTPEEED